MIVKVLRKSVVLKPEASLCKSLLSTLSFGIGYNLFSLEMDWIPAVHYETCIHIRCSSTERSNLQVRSLCRKRWCLWRWSFSYGWCCREESGLLIDGCRGTKPAHSAIENLNLLITISWNAGLARQSGGLENFTIVLNDTNFSKNICYIESKLRDGKVKLWYFRPFAMRLASRMS